MSAESSPITSARFAQAIQELPVENIYSKAHEIQNSISHLQRSNAQLQDYSDSIKNDASLDEQTRSGGDQDCLDAIRENGTVIQRQLERIDLLKREVERRGAKWHEEDPKTNGQAVDNPNGIEEAGARPDEPADVSAAPRRLTDDELRQRLEAQMRDDSDGGMHL